MRASARPSRLQFCCSRPLPRSAGNAAVVSGAEQYYRNMFFGDEVRAKCVTRALQVDEVRARRAEDAGLGGGGVEGAI